MRLPLFFSLAFGLAAQTFSPEYFVPSHRVAGIGVSRDDVSDELLEDRIKLMIENETFAIMREGLAAQGAQRVTGDAKLQSLFRSAATRSGFPQRTLEAIAYLESWGDATAESPAGPRGIMQISEATARSMGLTVKRTTRYRVTREQVEVRPKAPKNAKSAKKSKPKFKTVTHKTPYTVTTRDDRLSPDRAIPAAANYLAGMVTKFGGLDWAVFAYHCGQGCVARMMDLTRAARGIPPAQVSVARMFFSASPARNRDLYDAVQAQMQRDYSPTYWFRVMRAEQLLALWRRDPLEFEALAARYKSDSGAQRAPHRLSVWLRRDDALFHTAGDLRSPGAALARAFDRPAYFGYSLNVLADSPADLAAYSQASPPAVGALAYIAFETRRLYEAVSAAPFRPLPVAALVQPEDYARQSTRREAMAHTSGQVFDIDYSALPPAELECLRFVLQDLGWSGYLGFVDEGSNTLHIGCAPSARDFFTSVFEEASGPRVTR
jgi:hypothetical protein